jgi:hypothetical protein
MEPIIRKEFYLADDAIAFASGYVKAKQYRVVFEKPVEVPNTAAICGMYVIDVAIYGE